MPPRALHAATEARKGKRTMSPTKNATPRYRVAIIGTGRMGGLIEDEIAAGSFSKPYGHFSAYQAIEQTEVVAVANRGAAVPGQRTRRCPAGRRVVGANRASPHRT